MQAHSATCRAQAERQRALATSSPLANVRGVAALAAAAWEKELVQAEKREARAVETRRFREALAGTSLAAAPSERILSENPDRGYADR